MYIVKKAQAEVDLLRTHLLQLKVTQVLSHMLSAKY